MSMPVLNIHLSSELCKESNGAKRSQEFHKINP